MLAEKEEEEEEEEEIRGGVCYSRSCVRGTRWEKKGPPKTHKKNYENKKNVILGAFIPKTK